MENEKIKLNNINKVEELKPLNTVKYGAIKTQSLVINNVRFILQDFIDTSTLLTGLDIIKLERESVDAIVDIKPKLYEAFINKKTNLLKPFVKVNQTVKIKEEERDIIYTVLDIRFKRLNDMTVIIADLENNQTKEKSFALTNKLIPIKNENR